MESTNHVPGEHGITTAVVTVSAFIFMLFAAAMIAFGAWGAPFVDGLSAQIGEVVAQHATDLAAAGEHAKAVRIYEDALARRFEGEPLHRIYTMLRLVKSHQALEQSAQARSVLEMAFALDKGYGPTYTLLFDALRKRNDVDGALSVTQEHVAAVRARGDTAAEKWAKYNEGAVLRDAGRNEEALAAFVESHALQPSPESGYQCARLEYTLGKYEDARQSLEQVIEAGDTKYSALAREMLEKGSASKHW
ncbi:MAG: tetratricopeptide repeat protein [Candidatus Hydrogenedentes bacterium]|nr:tetratricopeptide repeat protein [Candidatus Hydrogenedentota bacterium]